MIIKGNELVQVENGDLEEGFFRVPEGITTIRNTAFAGCSGLTQLEIPKGVTTIGSHTFAGCSGLTKLKIPEGVTTIGIEA